MEPIDWVVSFNPRDLTRIIVLHEDTLVLSLKIANFQVCQVLIDSGNSTNLLHILVFKQMGISISTLGSLDWVLIGFNGSTIQSLGEIVFPIEIDPTALNIRFLFVLDPSPYNTILGQAWIHKMKATLSTYHQKVNFLTKTRQVDLFGN